MIQPCLGPSPPIEHLGHNCYIVTYVSGKREDSACFMIHHAYSGKYLFKVICTFPMGSTIPNDFAPKKLHTLGETPLKMIIIYFLSFISSIGTDAVRFKIYTFVSFVRVRNQPPC